MLPFRASLLLVAFSFGTATLSAQSAKSDAFSGTLGSSPSPSFSTAPSVAAPSAPPKTKQVARKLQRRSSKAQPESQDSGLPFDGPGGPSSGTLRDGSGAIAESITTGVDGRSTTRRDAKGRIKSTGSVSPDGKSTTYRDANGQITGRVDTNPDGDRTTARGADGLIKYTTSTSGTRTTYRGANGLIIGTKDITPAGNVVYRNANGTITGPDFK